RLRAVDVQALDVERLAPLIGDARTRRLEQVAASVRGALGGRAILNVNSTATGGGVAEMLQTLVAYTRGMGVDARWLVIDGDPDFFAITKRIHNGLYGDPGDGGPLGDAERACYETVQRRNAEELLAVVRPGDVVIVHDPQPAGLTAAAKRAGATVLWRCHVGRDEPNEWTRRAWAFLAPYLADADGFVVSRAAFAPPFAARERVHVIPPSIDPFSTKNAPLTETEVEHALAYVGLLSAPDGRARVPFVRHDGSPGRITRRVDVVQAGPAPPPDAPLVVQVSRWDRMKDMAGVMSGFAAHVDRSLGAHLLLVGPAVTGVADDPEAAAVLAECLQTWHRLPHAARTRVHLACTPMRDADEQATIVNAIQHHAAVVVQKSLAEGFGLTVAEAMWKARPIVASAVGGIRDQITDGKQGLLLDDPHDLPAFGAAVERLLRDPHAAAAMGAAARERAAAELLPDRHLERWAAVLTDQPGSCRNRTPSAG
ncbi:MAG TPA: glycosyltransferase, partial [Conexibacter sp.]|nr:glycosyltransferase [Conexibacter sp.]